MSLRWALHFYTCAYNPKIKHAVNVSAHKQRKQIHKYVINLYIFLVFWKFKVVVYILMWKLKKKSFNKLGRCNSVFTIVYKYFFFEIFSGYVRCMYVFVVMLGFCVNMWLTLEDVAWGERAPISDAIAPHSFGLSFAPKCIWQWHHWTHTLQRHLTY